jgi:hypothetical protein
MVFEFIHFLCKPQINQIQQQMGGGQLPMELGGLRKDRKGNTEILKKFILKSDLIGGALKLIGD